MGTESARERYDRAPCGLLVVSVTDEILDANAMFGQWIGRPAADIVGAGFSSLLDPSSRLFYETRHRQTLHISGRVDEVALSFTLPDGSALPVLINAVVDEIDGERLVRTAVFRAADRIAYERELLRARRDAERSEARVRILQDVSRDFGSSANDQEVADAFVTAAREAFTAVEAAVHLVDGDGRSHLIAGADPIGEVLQAADALWNTAGECVHSVQELEPIFPDLATALRALRREAISILPLVSGEERLGVLVCLFARAWDFDADFLDLQGALGRQAAQTLVRVRLRRELEYLATHDALTAIPNRQFIERRLQEAIQDASRRSRPLTVVFLDLDDFKAVNDTLGHGAGDEVLHVVAERLRAAVRSSDIVGRIGGDEFIAICADADAPVARTIAERIRARTLQPVQTPAATVDISVSVGLAVYDPAVDAPPTPDELLSNADGAMYLSKEAGKNRVSIAEHAGARPL